MCIFNISIYFDKLSPDAGTLTIKETIIQKKNAPYFLTNLAMMTFKWKIFQINWKLIELIKLSRWNKYVTWVEEGIQKSLSQID